MMCDDRVESLKFRVMVPYITAPVMLSKFMNTYSRGERLYD